jgi:hypothetical protein
MNNQRWREELMARYPNLFHVKLDDRIATLGFPEVGDGWRELLEIAVSRIATAMAAAPRGSLRIVQIKEKLGTLRLYRHADKLSRAVENSVNQAVALAEARSACTCEVCGAEGRLYNSGGSLATACAEHANGTIVALKPGWENLHVIRGYVGEKMGIFTYQRYVRKTDSFVDVDPKSLGIEE